MDLCICICICIRPSYPQGIALAPADIPQGSHFSPALYVVATNNKEDVWLARMDLTGALT